jgi:hypothetical protein
MTSKTTTKETMTLVAVSFVHVCWALISNSATYKHSSHMMGQITAKETTTPVAVSSVHVYWVPISNSAQLGAV